MLTADIRSSLNIIQTNMDGYRVNVESIPLEDIRKHVVYNNYSDVLLFPRGPVQTAYIYYILYYKVWSTKTIL